MSLSKVNVPKRRRGRVLEEALLEAAWAELVQRGYDQFTIDAAATRAATSRAVLYRRWPDKQALVRAAILHAVGKDVVTAPNTGTLRSDVIALLHQGNERRIRVATQVFAQVGDFNRAIGTSLSELSSSLHDSQTSVVDRVIQQAVDRGEIKPGQITDRIARLPVDLFRHEVLMTMQPVPKEVIEEIVDTIFLPLVHRTPPDYPAD